MTINYGVRRGKEEEKKNGNVASGKGDNKNKWHVYLSIDEIKLVCTLSFTFESNDGTNLKAL